MKSHTSLCQWKVLTFNKRKTWRYPMSFTYKSILPTPEQIKGEFPLAPEYAKLKAERDKEIADVFTGRCGL